MLLVARRVTGYRFIEGTTLTVAYAFSTVRPECRRWLLSGKNTSFASASICSIDCREKRWG
jgi:hypothetical protein